MTKPIAVALAVALAAYSDCFKGTVECLGFLGDRRISELVYSLPVAYVRGYTGTYWALDDGSIAKHHDVTDEVTLYHVNWHEW